MKLLIITLLIVVLFTGCNFEKDYVFKKTIQLNGINPISAVVKGSKIFVSDSKNNRIVEISEKGNILKSYSGFKRPMHISTFQDKILVPEYLNDSIKVIANDKILPLILSVIPSAPAGIDVSENLIAIADFYNHRIIVKNNDETYVIAEKGHKAGELFYPTDVKIVKDKIVVADAYNNRVQIFSVKGKLLVVIGEKDKIKVATGIDADESRIFVTDSENSRVLIYDWEGNKIKELTQSLNYPIDVTISNDKLLICNFHVGNIAVYKK